MTIKPAYLRQMCAMMPMAGEMEYDATKSIDVSGGGCKWALR